MPEVSNDPLIVPHKFGRRSQKGRGRAAIVRYKLIRIYLLKITDWVDKEKKSYREVIENLGVARQTFFTTLKFINRYSQEVYQAAIGKKEQDWDVVEKLIFGSYGDYKKLPFYKRMMEDIAAGRLKSAKKPGPKPGSKRKKTVLNPEATAGTTGNDVAASPAAKPNPFEKDQNQAEMQAFISSQRKGGAT